MELGRNSAQVGQQFRGNTPQPPEPSFVERIAQDIAYHQRELARLNRVQALIESNPAVREFIDACAEKP